MKITIDGKEYVSGKITRPKYKLFRDSYNELATPDKQVFTDEDLDKMVDCIVAVYDNQFTVDDVNNNLDVPEIIFNYSIINAEIMSSLFNQAADAKKNFTLPA